jgi:hypothetical protein
VDGDELVGVAEEHRAAGVAAAGPAVGLAGDVLEEQEQIGEAMADTTLSAGRISRADRAGARLRHLYGSTGGCNGPPITCAVVWTTTRPPATSP